MRTFVAAFVSVNDYHYSDAGLNTQCISRGPLFRQPAKVTRFALKFLIEMTPIHLAEA